MIFDSACSGSTEKMEMIFHPLEIGNYQVDTRIIEKQGYYLLILHKISAA